MNVKHYLKDGKEWTGSYHKMSDGALHTNKTHTKTRAVGASNGSQEISKVPKVLDKAEMAY